MQFKFWITDFHDYFWSYHWVLSSVNSAMINISIFGEIIIMFGIIFFWLCWPQFIIDNLVFLMIQIPINSIQLFEKIYYSQLINLRKTILTANSFVWLMDCCLISWIWPKQVHSCCAALAYFSGPWDKKTGKNFLIWSL